MYTHDVHLSMENHCKLRHQVSIVGLISLLFHLRYGYMDVFIIGNKGRLCCCIVKNTYTFFSEPELENPCIDVIFFSLMESQLTYVQRRNFRFRLRGQLPPPL